MSGNLQTRSLHAMCSIFSENGSTWSIGTLRYNSHCHNRTSSIDMRSFAEDSLPLLAKNWITSRAYENEHRESTHQPKHLVGKMTFFDKKNASTC